MRDKILGKRKDQTSLFKIEKVHMQLTQKEYYCEVFNQLAFYAWSYDRQRSAYTQDLDLSCAPETFRRGGLGVSCLRQLAQKQGKDEKDLINKAS